MSVRTSKNKEVIQWGYTALVCIALAFTRLTGAAANTESAEIKPASENAKWGVCTANRPTVEMSEMRPCEADSSSLSSEHGNLSGSVFVNTGFSPDSRRAPLLSPLRERHAD